MKSEMFYAKIMLFGEYCVIFDSMGLTVPYPHFTGELSFIDYKQFTGKENAVESNRHLREYLPFLKDLREESPEQFPLDLEGLEKDIREGLYFESNIPQGYGIGSSGALVAAIYERYTPGQIKAQIMITGTEIAALKAIFSRMESYFHGVSSGLDPLLCYIRHPLLIRNKSTIETVSIHPDQMGANSAIFLIDTGVLGKTGPLVNLFFDRCSDKLYFDKVKKVFIPANNSCIETFLEGAMDPFFDHLAILSDFQYHHLAEMIPLNMAGLWKMGLERGDFKMKLCGSGGGGFMLGISRDFKTTRQLFLNHGHQLIPVYNNDHH